MANANIADRATAAKQARQQAIYHAAAESSAIASLLRKMDGEQELDFVLRGALLRIEALGNAACQLLDSEDEDVIASEYQVVFGDALSLSGASFGEEGRDG